MWTLMRGNEILGEVHPHAAAKRARDPDVHSGLLVPRVDPRTLTSISQHRVELPGYRFISELPSHAPDGTARATRASRGRVALKPVPPGTPLGVSPDQQLRIVDEVGATVETRAIMVSMHRLDPTDPERVSVLPAAIAPSGEVWLVHFWRSGPAAT